ncbi:hypothetical protein MTR62_01605 [Novosphingobium sp. 1949]|uniref:Uncharacterized protein n=1 Tax=Novosphingobium organovorum TaxID=2930092 RepID=A0ABT0B8L6_9SPHN|nr:hypothetical protein [Novosphingobium organovorum]MCJ2181407.1 hypothetical protein [Novosphingobium organovorum]
MSTMGTISGIIAILCCLFLVSGHSGFRRLGLGRTARLALIWAVIIVALVIVINLFQGAGVQSSL